MENQPYPTDEVHISMDMQKGKENDNETESREPEITRKWPQTKHLRFWVFHNDVTKKVAEFCSH